MFVVQQELDAYDEECAYDEEYAEDYGNDHRIVSRKPLKCFLKPLHVTTLQRQAENKRRGGRALQHVVGVGSEFRVHRVGRHGVEIDP